MLESVESRLQIACMPNCATTSQMTSVVGAVAAMQRDRVDDGSNSAPDEGGERGQEALQDVEHAEGDGEERLDAIDQPQHARQAGEGGEDFLRRQAVFFVIVGDGLRPRKAKRCDEGYIIESSIPQS